MGKDTGRAYRPGIRRRHPDRRAREVLIADVKPLGKTEVSDDPGRDWMLSVQGGDMQAFDAMVRHYQAPVLHFIGRYLSDAARSEDIAQEAFFRVYKARHRYEPTAKFRTWLFTIVSRLCLNEIRGQRRRRRVVLDGAFPGRGQDETGEDLMAAVADDRGETPAAMAERRELETVLQRCIDSLPHNQRAAILLLRAGSPPYQEIADTLEITVPAVKSIINRARETIRQCLDSYRIGNRPRKPAVLGGEEAS